MHRALTAPRGGQHGPGSDPSVSFSRLCLSPSSSTTTRSSATTSSSTRNNRNSQRSSSKRTPHSKTSSVKTSAMTIHSSHHGRLRRQQRFITKRQLQKALKHGKREPIFHNSQHGRAKYTHDGIVFIYDERRKREITSYVAALDLPYQHLTAQNFATHRYARDQIRANASQYCKSHTVLLIDTSGSMRQSDVSGSRSRLSAVFLSVAEDFVRQRIESGVAGPRDAISIFLMTEATPKPLIHNVPTDWLTYNEILEVYKNGMVPAQGHCCYIPALQKAEDILGQYDDTSTCLMLAVFSDGRPSDASIRKTSYEASTKLIESSIESLASQLGQRLTVMTVGIGSNDKDGFKTLQQLCQVADNFGSRSDFQLPSMSVTGLGGAMSSIATSLTASQLNDNDGVSDANRGGFGSPLPRRIRKVSRESRSAIPMLTEVVSTEEFHIYNAEQDQVSHYIYEPSSKQFVRSPLQNDFASGVALRRQPFGEGKERFAYQFFELAADGETVVGEPLVAKMCKLDFTERKQKNPKEYWEWADRFVRRFCRLHHHASVVAAAFNKKLDTIRLLDPDTARVEFVPCSVYYLQDDNAIGMDATNNDASAHNATDEEEYAVIVEPRLFGKFQKWNSNNGWTKEKSPRKSAQNPTPARSLMAPIKEEDEDMALPDDVPSSKKSPEIIDVDEEVPFSSDNRPEIIDVDGEGGLPDDVPSSSYTEIIDVDEDEGEYVFVTPDEVAQAFSHFSYVHGGRTTVICDLQGVLINKIDDSADSGRRKVLQLTDPAVHYHHTSDDDDDKNSSNKKHNARYGRTDCGEKGIEDFLKTHVCNGLCPLVTKGFFSAPPMSPTVNHAHGQPASLNTAEPMNETS